MATMITTDCINCGACEPECPNNAISQGEAIFVIDPKLCTECVGFHDFEACAAVCPVDCCVTDPNNIETEDVLIARARAIHPNAEFSENFESRFRKGQGKPAVAAAPKRTPEQPPPTSTGAGGEATVAMAQAAPAPAIASMESAVNFVALPDIDTWDIPIRCFKCNETHVEPVRNFMIGNVLFCPHCNQSMVVRDNLNYHIRSLLRDAYEKWEREQKEFIKQRDESFAQFNERTAKESQDFVLHQQREIDKIRQQLSTVGETYDAPGKPIKKGSRFGWG